MIVRPVDLHNARSRNEDLRKLLEEAGWRIKQLEAESEGWQSLCEHKEGLLTSQSVELDDLAVKLKEQAEGRVEAVRAEVKRTHAASWRATVANALAETAEEDRDAANARADKAETSAYKAKAVCQDAIRQRNAKAKAARNALERAAKSESELDNAREMLSGQTHRELVAALADRLWEDPEPDGRVAEAVRSRKATPITRTVPAVPQGPGSGVAAIIGTWPGNDDEPDEPVSRSMTTREFSEVAEPGWYRVRFLSGGDAHRGDPEAWDAWECVEVYGQDESNGHEGGFYANGKTFVFSDLPDDHLFQWGARVRMPDDAK